MRALLLAAAAAAAAAQNTYQVDGSGCAANPSACRTLHGVGGLSGGGATSVFLPYYPEPQRSQILDYLFKPNFGASLHILKVEIGGDAQSTDGAEASHMHNPWDENYRRGYEWWLMTEAKKRNPDIKLYGLSWAFPQWVTCSPGTLANCSGNNPYPYPEQLAGYITKWVAGAKNTYDLDIDYIGSWNERAYNTTYLKTLRSTLDANGFTNTKIVAPDSNWGIASDILADPELAEAVFGIGAHYPGTYSSSQAEATGKPLWASEDDSTYNNDVGAECWARVINQNFVNGNMTASINWNLVAAYMKGTNWWRAGLMNALQPWSGAFGATTADGSFTAGPMIWASAHTTQFSQPGWTYLLNGTGAGTGSGRLAAGGSYVTLVDYAGSGGKDFSIVIEKMSHARSSCVRPHLPNYDTAPEVATFTLAGGLAATTLAVWKTHWAYDPSDVTVEFERQPDITVVNGQFSLNVTVDSLYTITTLTAAGGKGTVPTPPEPFVFPTAWTDDFESCPISSEAALFADQNGAWECRPGDAAHGTVMTQMVPLRPVTWGGDVRPHSLVGHRDTFDGSLNVDAFIPSPGGSVLLGVHMQGTDNSGGIIFSYDEASSTWFVHSSIQAVDNNNAALASGPLPNGLSIRAGEWHTYRLDVNGTGADQVFNVWVDGIPVIAAWNASRVNLSGHFAIGTRQYGDFTSFDNFAIYSAFRTCGTTAPAAGTPVSLVNCASEVGIKATSQWLYQETFPGSFNGSFALKANPSLCMTLAPADSTGNTWVQLQPCSAGNPAQVWSWNFEGIAPDTERASWIVNPATGRCLDQYGQASEIGNALDAYPCNHAGNQAFFFDYDAGEIANEATSVCLGVC